MVTIYDIAKQANVSAMTVSRVINNSGRISEKTRKKVKKVMEELNYVPNSMARSLVIQKTKILSLLITDITNPFYTTVARGAEDAAKKLGYRLLFSNSDEDVLKEREYVDMLLSARVDGVLFAPAGDSSREHLLRLRDYGIPFVLMDREVPDIDSDMVVGDSKEGSRKLMDHLIALGHRRIAFINGSTSVSTARLRHEGYAESLKLHDLSYDPLLVAEAGYKQFEATGVIQSWLELTEPPTAIFAANNFIALGAIRSIRELGLHVPDDLSVVCFDDLELASQLDPFLTVAAQPAYSFGSIGIQTLVERIETDSKSAPDQQPHWKKIILPSKLIIRRSARKLNTP